MDFKSFNAHSHNKNQFEPFWCRFMCLSWEKEYFFFVLYIVSMCLGPSSNNVNRRPTKQIYKRNGPKKSGYLFPSVSLRNIAPASPLQKNKIFKAIVDMLTAYKMSAFRIKPAEPFNIILPITFVLFSQLISG